MNTVSERLAALRQALRRHQLDAWLVPSADPHLSEYLPEHWQVRQWLSGFTGSAGTLVLTEHEAALWVDSRYYEQAAQQLNGSGIVMEKLENGRNHLDWLRDRLPENGVLGAAADMLSLSAKRRLQTLAGSAGGRLRDDVDAAGEVWGAARPALPQQPVYAHDDAFTDESAADKLARVRAFMREKGADWHLISSLDDIGWLTNLRGSDVEYNPVFLSYLLIGSDTATLFVDEAKLDAAVRARLQAAGIGTAAYGAVAEAVAALSGSLLLDADRTAASTLARLPENVRLIEHLNPAALFKSQKTERECQHIRQAMVQDGAALCGFFAEFEQKLADGTPMTELDIADMLTAHRSRQPHYISPSFGTIAGFNANGALPHYSATAEAHSAITGNGLLLIDSGAQYQNGTTDITRVVPVGETTAAQRRDFTLVLKAHIALARLVFPEEMPAPVLDAVCRAPLWAAQCDYGHGTGHGVGYFMNVHEGPQVIACRAAANPHHAMKVGMLTSNEPGLYRPGQWGIRIENLVLNRRVAQPQEQDFGTFLYFETVTLCPIDTRLVETALLTAEERDWLNAYHAEVRAKLEAHTTGAAKDWLLARTQPV